DPAVNELTRRSRSAAGGKAAACERKCSLGCHNRHGLFGSRPCLNGLWKQARFDQEQCRTEPHLHISEAQQGQVKRLARQALDLDDLEPVIGRKLLDQPAEPSWILDEQAPVLLKVIVRLREENRKISRRGGELCLVIFEIRLDIGWIREDEIESAVNIREHVALRDSYVFPSKTPTIFFRIIDGSRADVYGENFPRHAGSKHCAHAASAAQVEHPVALVAIFHARLLVFKRLVHAGENDETRLAQRDGGPQHIQLPNMPIPI